MSYVVSFSTKILLRTLTIQDSTVLRVHLNAFVDETDKFSSWTGTRGKIVTMDRLTDYDCPRLTHKQLTDLLIYL